MFYSISQLLVLCILQLVASLEEPNLSHVCGDVLIQRSRNASGLHSASQVEEDVASPAVLTNELSKAQNTKDFSQDTVKGILLTCLAGIALPWIYAKWTATAEKIVAIEGHSDLLDNCKWIAQVLVIFNHMVYFASVNRFFNYDRWTLLSGSGVDSLLKISHANSFLVNPMFCFISGVVSQGKPSYRRVVRYVQYLVLPTLIFHFLMEPAFTVGVGTLDPEKIVKDTAHTLTWSSMSTHAHHSPAWYLFALCLWRGSAFLVWSHLPARHALVGMMFVSCLCGYHQLPDEGMHGFNTAAAYLPYFGLGFFFPFQAVVNSLPQPSVLTCCLVFALVSLYLSVLAPLICPTIDLHGWYGYSQNPFPNYSIPEFLNAGPWDYSLWWSRRVAKFLLDMVAPLLLIFVVFPRSKMPLTYLGQHTLYSYLFQWIGFYWWSLLASKIGFPVITSTAGHIGVLFAVYLPLSLLTLIFFTSSYWRALWSWGLSPRWLDPASKKLVDYLTAEPGSRSAEKC
ncbi:unnamed protein product [Polarella glacialis]|uniref:Acyltransferase 3 domain-containing protein n=1 Tax=Polarella glacialis TaxID=89957 RepID=A0A813FJT0_POLGL|nr:unnamed protein product [Polarella glacialis]